VSSIAEIEDAVCRLSPDDFARFSAWFDERRSRLWDRQIEGDAANGKLLALYRRLNDDEQPQVPLDEFLDDPQLSRKVP